MGLETPGEPKYVTMEKDPNGRQIFEKKMVIENNQSIEKLIIRDAYIMNVQFDPEKWNNDVARETINEILAAIKSLPSNGIIYSILDCNGVDIPRTLQLRFDELGREQSKFGLQVLVKPSLLMDTFASVYRNLFNGRILSAHSVEAAQEIINDAISTNSYLAES
ncbi:MAG: hypothetical protein ABIM99_01510 [Candidatus Dojkabacteria bacterium]